MTEEAMAAFQLQDTHQVLLSIGVEDAAGNPVPAPPDWPAPIWDKADVNNAVTITAGTDHYSALVAANGPLGSVQVQVMGGPNNSLRGIFDLDVIASEATTILVNAGASELKPAPAAPAAPVV